MNHDDLIAKLRQEVAELQAQHKALTAKVNKLADKCCGMQKRVSFLEDQAEATTSAYVIEDLVGDAPSTGGGS